MGTTKTNFWFWFLRREKYIGYMEFWSENLKRTVNFRDLAAYWTIIIKCIFKYRMRGRELD
jgi:hypothetical protein